MWYTYYANGPVSNITVRDLSDRFVRSDLAMYYNGNGTLWMAVWGEWQVDEDGYVDDSYTITAAREFHFDSRRARYLCRDIDPATVATGDLTPLEPQRWTDYAGDLPYIDYDVSNAGVETNKTRYTPAAGIAGQYDFATQQSTYPHGDMLRSTVVTTNSAGLADHTFAYTAFGEAVTYDVQAGWQVGFPPTDPATRYLYAGGWGYEDDLLALSGPNPDLPPITLQHVGHRWYEPSTGRFVQRDPIGIFGGLNMYGYCSNQPLSCVDPSGLDGGPGDTSDLWILWHQMDDNRPAQKAYEDTLNSISAGVIFSMLCTAVGGALGQAVADWVNDAGSPEPYEVGPPVEIDPDAPLPVWPTDDDIVRPSIPDDCPGGPIPPPTPWDIDKLLEDLFD